MTMFCLFKKCTRTFKTVFIWERSEMPLAAAERGQPANNEFKVPIPVVVAAKCWIKIVKLVTWYQ